VETVEAGWNRLVGADPEKIVEGVRFLSPCSSPDPIFGDGKAASLVVEQLIINVAASAV